MKLYSSVEKGLKLKVRKWLIATFVEVTGEKLVWKGGKEGGGLLPPILNRVKCVTRKTRYHVFIAELLTLSLFTIGFFGAAHGWRGKKAPPPP